MCSAKISDMVGLTFRRVYAEHMAELHFIAETGEHFKFHHIGGCCESVDINDICGDLADLIGSPLLQADESSNQTDPPPSEHAESYTWTFYRFATAKGAVTVRWYGESNGYYSESVDFDRIV